MRKKNILLIISCLFLICACNDSQQDKTESQYKTLKITRTDQTLQSDYTARLKGRQEVEIRPQVSGLITDIRINEGDAVKRDKYFSSSTRFLTKLHSRQLSPTYEVPKLN